MIEVSCGLGIGLMYREDWGGRRFDGLLVGLITGWLGVIGGRFEFGFEGWEGGRIVGGLTGSLPGSFSSELSILSFVDRLRE